MSEKKLLRNGKSGSRATKPRPVRDILYPSPQLEKILRAVFDDWQEIKDPAKREEYRRDFVFHMTDWLNDLEELNDLYEHPEKFSKAKASQLVFGFLIHVLPHLNAAGRLLLNEIADPFKELYRSSNSKR